MKRSNTFNGYEVQESNFTIVPEWLNAPIQVWVNGGNNICIVSVKMKYPRIFDALRNTTYAIALDRNNARNFDLKNPQYFRKNVGVWPVPSHMECSSSAQGAIPAGLFFALIDTVNVNPIEITSSYPGAWQPGNKRSIVFPTQTPTQRALNAPNQATNIEKRFAPLPAGDTLITYLTYDTRLSVGVHQLTIDVNPYDDQPEQIRNNNVGTLQFYVERDLRNPLPNVTFDGVEERLALADERIRLYPAEIRNGKNNRARIEFSPAFTKDGGYALFVEAEDDTGNKTGDIDHVVSLITLGYDYKISFKVITESIISKLLNYPNPFSTSTRFLYTLTGSEPPAYCTIQILTEYAWDGRDELGDPPANGEDFKAYTTGADAFFEKGCGNIVIIR